MLVIVRSIFCLPIDLSTSIARVMMAADFTMDNMSAPLLTNNATVDDELAYNSTSDQVNILLDLQEKKINSA